MDVQRSICCQLILVRYFSLNFVHLKLCLFNGMNLVNKHKGYKIFSLFISDFRDTEPEEK